MIRHSKQADERREAERREGNALECWCLHGAVGAAADWRECGKRLATAGVGTRAVDLWRFLEEESLPPEDFARELNAEASGEVDQGGARALLGYSMGGRLALHALLENDHPWQAAVIVSAHAGLESDAERAARRTNDTSWATKALMGNWGKFLGAWDAQPVFGNALPRDPAAGAALVRNRREIARAFVDWSLAAQSPLWPALGEIDVPVLWIAGENDPKFVDLAGRAVERIPQGELAIAPGAGHRVPWENPEWFVEKVSRFLLRSEA